MDENKKIIKAGKIKSGEAHVETVNLGQRRFQDHVFKNLDPQGKVELGQLNAGEEFKAHPHAHAAEDVEVAKEYDDEGALKAIRLTCKCGEVIELEFTQE